MQPFLKRSVPKGIPAPGMGGPGGTAAMNLPPLQSLTLTGDFDPLHMDHEFAQQTPFGKPIAHGLLGLSLVAGLASNHPRVQTLAFLSIDQWDFLKPMFIGDTVHEEQKVLSRRETKDPSRGVIVVECKLVNQKGEVVQEGKRTIMVARRQTED